MKLKLTQGKVQVVPMKISELVNRTYLEYEFEEGTAHLHPSLTIQGELYSEYGTFIHLPHIDGDIVNIKVELFDDNHNLIRLYTNELAYNKYQITGKKPIRPDIEEYIFSLEQDIRVLKQTLIDEEIKYKEIIKQLEEKGELV